MDRLMKFLTSVMPGILLCLAVVTVANILTPWDDTDSPDGRSGMELLTDHKTGCQYLYRRGAITPRMGADGKQICGLARQ